MRNVQTTPFFDFEPSPEDVTLALCKLDKPKPVAEKHWCACKRQAETFCAECKQPLCRIDSFKWHRGFDYCRAHLPESQLGVISVGSVKFTDITEGVYIGREVTTSKDYYPRSLLANPQWIDVLTATEEEKQENLARYRALLNVHRLAKDEVYLYSLDLRDMVLRGLDLRLLCWCKTAEGGGSCHGDIVKNFLNYLVSQVRK